MRNKFSKVSDPASFITESGDRIREIYDSKVRPDGTIDVVTTGKESLFDYIQSFKHSCDMNYIIKQLSLGDVSVLAKGTPQYGDFTKAPKTMAEALQIQIDAKRAWDGLPVDQRAAFDNDFTKWLCNVGTDDWNLKMGLVTPEVMNEEGKESTT